MKSYTDLEQSKKLAEILPLESADMYYPYNVGGIFCYHKRTPRVRQVNNHFALFYNDIPCWSLSALMNILEKEKVEICFTCSGNKYWVDVHFETWGCFCQDHELYDSKIDALIAMIKKLKSRNLL